MKHKEELLKTLDFIEANPEKLEMTMWQCGTQACIVGWYCLHNPEANLRFTPSLSEVCGIEHIGDVIKHGMQAAAFYFDISISDAFNLFSPADPEEEVTPAEYVKVVRNFIGAEA